MNLSSLTILATLLFSPLGKSVDLSVGWDLWYPYQYHNTQRELVGIDIETLKVIMTQANLTFTTAEIPWKKHLDFIKTGKMDIAMGVFKSKEREKFAYFSLPYRQEKINLFVRKGKANSMPFRSLTELAGSPYLFGIASGYYYGSEFNKLSKLPDFQTNFREGVNLEHNVSEFLDGKLDGLLVDPFTMRAFIEKYDTHELFEQHPLEVYSANIHIMLSKKSLNTDVLKRINQAIEDLQKAGSLQEISKNWSAQQQINN